MTSRRNRESVGENGCGRLGSSNRQADRELIAELQRSVEGVSFDEMPMPELVGDDLDIDAIRRAFTGIRDIDEKALSTLKLRVKHQRKIVPSKGGILFFGRERTFHFSDCWVQCGRFIGRDKDRIFDHIELYDHLPLAVDSIMLFLKKHAMRGADFSGVRRRDGLGGVFPAENGGGQCRSRGQRNNHQPIDMRHSVRFVGDGSCRRIWL